MKSFSRAVLLLALAVTPTHADEKLQHLDWTISNKSLLMQAADSRAVALLLEKAWSKTSTDQAVVADFVFAELNKDGRLQLIVNGDAANRGHGNLTATVYVLSNVGGENPVLIQRFDVGPPGLSTLKGVVRDLNNDGVPELILPEYLGVAAGWHPVASVPHVYRWNGKQFVRDDGDFKLFYQNDVLPRLEQDRQALDKERSDFEHDRQSRSAPQLSDADVTFARQRLKEKEDALNQSVLAVQDLINKR